MALINNKTVTLNLYSNGQAYKYNLPPKSVLVDANSGKVTSFYLNNKFYVLGGSSSKSNTAERVKGMVDKISRDPRALAVLGGLTGAVHKPSAGVMGAFFGLTVGFIMKHLPDSNQIEGYYTNGNLVFESPTYFKV